MSILLQSSPWLILVCLLGALAATLLLYFRNKNFSDAFSGNKKLIWLLASLRFAGVFLVSFFLLSPLIKTDCTITEKPILVIAQDNSASLHKHFHGADSVAYSSAMNQFAQKLSNKFEVKLFSFGDRVRDSLRFNFKDQSTDIAALLNHCGSLFSNRNPGAIVLATDGIYNTGTSPLYESSMNNMPVYSIALGDTTVRKDLFFSGIKFNHTVYLGNHFTINPEIRASLCGGSHSAVSIFEVNENNAQQYKGRFAFEIQENNFETKTGFELSADRPGILHYRLKLDAVPGETSLSNNERDLFVEVKDKRDKILMLVNSPNPDIEAWREAVSSRKNYELLVKSPDEFSGKMEDFSLVIFYQLPSNRYPSLNLIEKAKQLNKPVLFIAGAQTLPQLFNAAQQAVSSQMSNGQINEVQAQLNNQFSLFSINASLMQTLASMPPLRSPYGDWKSTQTLQVLAWQKVGSVATRYPLIAFNDAAGIRAGYFLGEGIWRWRVYDFIRNKSHDAIDGLMMDMVQYLAIRPDNNQFRAEPKQLIFSENEPVIFDAELFNESFQPVNSPDVLLKVKSENGTEYPFTFSKSGMAYSLNAGFLPVGRYSYSATTQFNKKDFSVAGSFTISPLQLEDLQTVADHHLLQLLAKKTGGKVFYRNQLAALENELLSNEKLKPVIYTSTGTDLLLNFKWIFFLGLILLGGEWFLRRYFGSY